LSHPVDVSTDKCVPLDPTTEAEPVTSSCPEFESAHSEPVEVEATLNEPPELEHEMVPGQSQEPTEPSPVDTDNGQIEKNPLLDVLQDLVPKQVTPTDVVSCCAGQCDARNPLKLFSQTSDSSTQSHS
jgi:hypothetical protein